MTSSAELETSISKLSIEEPITRNVNIFKEMLYQRCPGCVIFMCNTSQDYDYIYDKYDQSANNDEDMCHVDFNIGDVGMFRVYIDIIMDSVESWYPDAVVKFSMGKTFKHLDYPYSVSMLVDKPKVTIPSSNQQ